MNKERIAAIIADDDFKAVVADIEAGLTRKVMATATSSEDREKALTEYHALLRLMAVLRDRAGNKEA